MLIAGFMMQFSKKKLQKLDDHKVNLQLFQTLANKLYSAEHANMFKST